ncbi:hypothetical protein RHVP.R9 [Cricetid gammaherpesvirus 2]|uniref:Uncharacterized protein n=1 Tax=Cricetid gammaherpesvirus 2 TaxID=1605972 RepID=E9M5I9_9GAMA|nr:hypothetical protein RHVP.R9 [Cricetid gammaherpesvirus 2]ADW24347.1 hypothetical protein RHVP.R9 [Cricetid gammaherpesvirus 2]ADW24429.1 hypothetical protein RHVP-L.R9 [Cricetid gammaherpesvirus 2]
MNGLYYEPSIRHLVRAARHMARVVRGFPALLTTEAERDQILHRAAFQNHLPPSILPPIYPPVQTHPNRSYRVCYMSEVCYRALTTMWDMASDPDQREELCQYLQEHESLCCLLRGRDGRKVLMTLASPQTLLNIYPVQMAELSTPLDLIQQWDTS